MNADLRAPSPPMTRNRRETVTDADDYIAAKRTSGPWRVEDGCVVAPWSELSPVKMDGGEIRMHHTGLIALVYGCPDPGERYSGPEANARLIAAAPTMHAYIEARAAAGDTEAKSILECIQEGQS